MRPTLLVLLALLAPFGSGCGLGSDDADPAVDDSDKRAVAMACLEEADVDARLDGEDAIVIGTGEDAPQIKFFLTSGEAEAAQFSGRAEGAEQIGQTLLYVRGGSGEVLLEIENCLAEL